MGALPRSMEQSAIKMNVTIPDHPRLAHCKRGNLVAGAGIEPATFG